MSAARQPGQLTQQLRAGLQLCRLPVAITAMADPLAGALVAGAGWRDLPFILALMGASACMFMGASALNDWHDFKRDLTAHPDRPLPAKKFRRWHVLLAVLVLLGVGTMLTKVPPAPANLVGLLLLSAILAHEVLVKNVPIAPGILGASRALNMLLGMSLVPLAASPADGSLRTYLMVVMGIYVIGSRLFKQADTSNNLKQRLLVGTLVTWVAVILLVLVRVVFWDRGLSSVGGLWIAILVGILGYRMTQAMLTPQKTNIEQANLAAMLGLILFDASIVAFSRGLLISLPVVVLLVPAVVSHKWLADRSNIANSAPPR